MYIYFSDEYLKPNEYENNKINHLFVFDDFIDFKTDALLTLRDNKKNAFAYWVDIILLQTKITSALKIYLISLERILCYTQKKT